VKRHREGELKTVPECGIIQHVAASLDRAFRASDLLNGADSPWLATVYRKW
jgi:hypothetical protein